MKRNLIFVKVLLLSLALALLHACQKDFVQSSDTSVSDEEFTLATAKQHFRSLDKRLAKENPVLADPKSSELLWSRSYVEHRTDVDFAEIPLAAKQRIIALYNFPQDSLKYKPDNTISSLSTQRLLLYKGKSGEIQERIVTYIPDKEYLVRRKAEVGLNSIKKLQSDFKGYIEYRTLSGEVTLILRIENRKIVRRYRLAQAMKTVEGTVDHGNVVSILGQNCTTTCIDIAYDYCYYKIIEDELHLFCEPATKTECNTYCEDIPDPDPDPNPNPTDPDPDPEPQPEYYDCNGVRNGSAYMAACGCIGGNTGITECPNEDLPDFDFCGGMSSTQKNNMTNTFTNVLNMNCATNAMVKQLKQTPGLSLTLCVDANTSGSGTYNPVDKSINFSTDFASTHDDIFRHEVFHAYQDNVGHSGGIANYSKGNPGFVNIEFEQAVFKDIMDGYPIALDASTNGGIKDNYAAWIDELTSGGTSYPDISSISNFETKYFEFLTEFNASDPIYGGGTIMPALKPEALKTIFNGLTKGNCGM